MKNIFEKKINTGITLIALVITIVVLIILATVVINLSLGDNGLFSRAREAKEQYNNAQQYEETEIAKYTNDINNYISGNRQITELEYNNLMSKIDESKIYEINFTTPAAVNGKFPKQQWIKVADYPDGLNYSNSVIVNAYIEIGSEKIVIPTGNLNIWSVLLHTEESGISMYINTSDANNAMADWTSCPGKILIKKIVN